jgi:spore protease
LTIESWAERYGHIRTDLALEHHETVRGDYPQGMPGVEFHEEEHDDIKVTHVAVTSAEGERLMGKPIGDYITIESLALRQRNRALQDRIAAVFAEQLEEMLPANWHHALVVGLGNAQATPDALGPRAVNELLITRHIRDFVPEELKGKLQSVAAIAPGVLGTTGIETGEVIRGIVEHIKPDVVIAIDALAARSPDRVVTSIQLANTGIAPGSGIGNKRTAITQESLGVPVIAAGVPTVVHATTIGAMALDLLVDEMRGKRQFVSIVAEMDQEDRLALVHEVMDPRTGNMMVTPKEIDVQILDMARIVAGGINAALHRAIGADNLASYLM